MSCSPHGITNFKFRIFTYILSSLVCLFVVVAFVQTSNNLIGQKTLENSELWNFGNSWNHEGSSFNSLRYCWRYFESILKKQIFLWKMFFFHKKMYLKLWCRKHYSLFHINLLYICGCCIRPNNLIGQKTLENSELRIGNSWNHESFNSLR